MTWGRGGSGAEVSEFHLDPCEPHFYIVKLGFSEVYIISVFYGFLVFLNEVLLRI